MDECPGEFVYPARNGVWQWLQQIPEVRAKVLFHGKTRLTASDIRLLRALPPERLSIAAVSHTLAETLEHDLGRPVQTLRMALDPRAFVEPLLSREQARQALDVFFQASRLLPQPEVLFRDDWQERINTFMHRWLQERQLALNTLSRQHRKELVEALYAEGAFNGKSATHYIANVLGLGRATVYKYLQTLK